ncbi:MAG: methyl-accepting chemotaxis protein [Mobilitalea sp.]
MGKSSINKKYVIEKKQGVKSRKEKIHKRIFGKMLGGIAAKLIISFMIPVCFVIVIGVVSYNTAASSIVQNYRKSSLQSIEMTSEYLRFGFDSVEATGLQYVVDNQIQNYFNGNYNEDESVIAEKNIKKLLEAKRISDNFISEIHIISKNANTMTTAPKYENDMYTAFLETEAGSKLIKKPRNSYWFGAEDYLDKTFSLDKKDYAIRYVRGFVTGKACIIIDIKASTLQEILAGLDFGTGSMVGFVTADGRELFAPNTKSKDNKEQIFSTEEFYQQSLLMQENSGSVDISFLGENYLYLYAKIGDTGAMVGSLIPEANILKQVKGIKNVTIILVLLSSLIAVFIGAKTASGMQKTIRYFIGELNKVSEGNLAVKLKINRKDEFSVLSLGINNMIESMRGLIEKVKIQSGSVTSSSEQVTKASDVFTNSTQGISESINEIQMGVTQQAEDSENCLLQMDNLSDKIQIVSRKTTEISEITAETKNSVTKGMESMGILNTKAKETTKITQQIINHIEVLEDKSKSISKIIETINNIAQQTNLLSLNASIEAARAGEYGRGFTVVAEEIRRLADQSLKSVKEIEGLIKEIQMQTKKTVIIASEADSVVEEQEVAVNNTEYSLQSLNLNVEKLIDNVSMITDSIMNIDVARAGTLLAVENISAVSQQTAAAAISVYNTTNEQLVAVQLLNGLSKELDENAQALENVVCQFVLD